MIGDTTYRVEFNEEDGTSVLIKMTQVSMDEVTWEQDGEGTITFTAKPQPVATPKRLDKYRLEPEGNLFRLHLLRGLPNIGMYAGQIGGLVAGPHNLSQDGDCWIDGQSKVTGNIKISGDAYISHSDVHGRGAIGGAAAVHNSVIGSQDDRHNDLYVTIHHASLHYTTIKGTGHLNIIGSTNIARSILITDENKPGLTISGGRIEDAEISDNSHHLSVWTRWGWLSVYRGRAGELRIRVGCQNMDDWDDLVALADGNGANHAEMEMIPHFKAMVSALQTLWPAATPEVTDVEEAGRLN